MKLEELEKLISDLEKEYEVKKLELIKRFVDLNNPVRNLKKTVLHEKKNQHEQFINQIFYEQHS